MYVCIRWEKRKEKGKKKGKKKKRNISDERIDSILLV